MLEALPRWDLSLPAARGEEGCVRFCEEFRGEGAVLLAGLLSPCAACERWQLREHLQASLGGKEAPVRVQSSRDNRTFNAVYHRAEDTQIVSVGAMLDATLFAPRSAQPTGGADLQRMYFKGKLSTGLCEDLGELPTAFFGAPDRLGASVAGETTFWVGSPHVVTPLHFDHCHTVIAQVVGRKRVIVSPLRDSHHLYPFSVADGAPRTSRVDLHAWLAGDVEQKSLYPDVARAQLLECILEPGDMVYIPPGSLPRPGSCPYRRTTVSSRRDIPCTHPHMEPPSRAQDLTLHTWERAFLHHMPNAGWWHHVEALEGNCSVLLPFDMTEAEQRALPRPWALPDWGKRRDDHRKNSIITTNTINTRNDNFTSNMELKLLPGRHSEPRPADEHQKTEEKNMGYATELPTLASSRDSDSDSETDYTGLADFIDESEPSEQCIQSFHLTSGSV